MAIDATMPGPGDTRAWYLHNGSFLPKGLQHLILPRTFLPDEINKEINNLAELTHLECSSRNGYWPSLDLISLKVRSSLGDALRAASALLL